MSEDSVQTKRLDATFVITLNRPQAKNAVDTPTARQLAAAFAAFEADDALRVAVFHGANGAFCAGADLKKVSQGDMAIARLSDGFDRMDPSAPMGPSYMRPSKPVIGAIAGHAVAGGLELALICDMRVVEQSAVFGVFCRRWGVPLVDGGTVRLPRIVGMGAAMDMILTGRAVDAEEAKIMGLANRVVPDGTSLVAALEIAERLARFPQTCMLSDRRSAYDQWDLSFEQAMINENRLGHAVLASGETVSGASRFAGGKGRGGSFEDL